MGKVEYDFREGLEKEKIVYKNNRWNYDEFFLYLLVVLVAWSWAAGWFALFFYAYIYNEPIAFWVFIACWLAFVAALITVSVVNLCRHYAEKKRKEADKKRLQREEEELHKKAHKPGHEHNEQVHDYIGTDQPLVAPGHAKDMEMVGLKDRN
jgi:hypothetical protein